MSIVAMQGFAGLILFSVFLLMALGLAIIFGQMGVINMAHGEFMILGAYMTYLTSHLFPEPTFPICMAVTSSSLWQCICGFRLDRIAAEWLLIRHLYSRPLDTLLATWA